METVTKTDLREFKEDLLIHLRNLGESIERVADYQREQNGKVADLAKVVAVHDDRFQNIKDSKGRVLSVIGSILAVIVSAILAALGGGPHGK